MEKINCYGIILFVSFFGVGVSSAQSFTVSFPDTIVYGPAIDSTSLSCWTNDDVINISGAPLTLDIVRVQDDTACPGWTSAFCFQVCSQPTVDSIRATMAPSEVVNMAIHFIITGVPDSGTILMKIKNVNNPSEVVYQRFYGISQSTFGIVDAASNRITANLFPNPAFSGQAVSLNIYSSFQTKTSYSLDIFNMLGDKVADVKDLQSGSNVLSLNLPAGIYSWQLRNGDSKVFSGKMIRVE